MPPVAHHAHAATAAVCLSVCCTASEDIFKEIDILCGLQHENVVYLKEYFEEGNKVGDRLFVNCSFMCVVFVVCVPVMRCFCISLCILASLCTFCTCILVPLRARACAIAAARVPPSSCWTGCGCHAKASRACSSNNNCATRRCAALCCAVQVYLMTELVTGGELLDAVLQRGTYSEAEARLAFVQLLHGIQYLHSK